MPPNLESIRFWPRTGCRDVQDTISLNGVNVNITKFRYPQTLLTHSHIPHSLLCVISISKHNVQTSRNKTISPDRKCVSLLDAEAPYRGHPEGLLVVRSEQKKCVRWCAGCTIKQCRHQAVTVSLSSGGVFLNVCVCVAVAELRTLYIFYLHLCYARKLSTITQHFLSVANSSS